MDAWTAGRMRISLLRGLSMVGRAEKEKREALLSFYVLAVVGCGVGGANREPDIHATRMWRRDVFGFRLWDSIHDRIEGGGNCPSAL